MENNLTADDDDSWAAALTMLPEATLEEVNRLWTIARAFSNTAHAVNNSLQVIGGRAELLESRAGLDSALVPGLQAVRAQSGRAATAIGELLAYSRNATESQLLNLGEIVDVTIAMRTHSLSRARIDIAVERQEGGQYQTLARRREVLQLLLNLVLMFEAQLASQPQARIVIRLEHESSQSRVVVTGSAAPDATVSTSRPEDFNLVAQQRVVKRLARRMGADLAIKTSDQRLSAFTLTMSSAAAVT